MARMQMQLRSVVMCVVVGGDEEGEEGKMGCKAGGGAAKKRPMCPYIEGVMSVSPEVKPPPWRNIRMGRGGTEGGEEDGVGDECTVTPTNEN